MSPTFDHERAHWNRGIRRVFGIDECGRGPVAGPVVASSAWFAPETSEEGLDWVHDSKDLSESRVQRAAERLRELPDDRFRFSIAYARVSEIDRLGIRAATVSAWRRSLEGLSDQFARGEPHSSVILVDGPGDSAFGHPHVGIVKGDRNSITIAAASLLGKAHRDQVMRRLAACHPDFSCLASNKGYLSQEHRLALDHHGPVAGVHRMSFAPICQPRLL